MKRVKYIDHIVTQDGVQADPEKVDEVRDWPTPKSPEDVRQFLGFAGYYRKFIQDFSKIARPLIDIMAIGKKPRGKQKLPPSTWNWGPSQEKAFALLKKKLTSAPVLGYPEFNSPFELHTYACQSGLGAVLYQEQEGVKMVIAYASRGLSKSERNYPTHKLEFLALKWAITEKFSDYLTGQTFSVFTDNNPLTYVLTSAKLDATGHRWVTALSSYNFSITYKPGKSNTDADLLSRLPSKMETMNGDTVRAVMDEKQPYIETLSVPPSICQKLQTTDILDKVDRHTDLKQIQREDPVISSIIDYIRKGKRPPKNSANSETEAILHQNFKKLELEDNILVRVTHRDGIAQKQYVVPCTYSQLILRYLHNNMGHPCRDKTIA